MRGGLVHSGVIAVVELVVREALSLNRGGASLLQSFIRSLQLLRDTSRWPDPADPCQYLEVLPKKSEHALRLYAVTTLSLWDTRIVQVWRGDVCHVIGKHGLSMQALEDLTGAVFLVHNSSGDTVNVHVCAWSLTEQGKACRQLQSVSQGKLLPHRWRLVDSTADVAEQIMEGWSRNSVAMELRRSVEFGSGLLQAAKCCFEMVMADEADKWEVVVSLAPRCERATRRSLQEFLVVQVPLRSVKRIIGECGATIRNLEVESGAAIRLNEP